MTNKQGLRRLYLFTAILFALTMSIHAVIDGRDLDFEALELYQFIEGIFIVVWLMMDPGLPAAQRPSFDHGLLLMMSFPFLALYHQFATRRWKGIATVFGLLLLLYAPLLSSLLLLPVHGL